MSHFLFLSLFIPLYFLPSAQQFQLALFASIGCFSHDHMMREVGQTIESMNSSSTIEDSDNGTQRMQNQIHWIQIFMYDFGFGQLSRPRHWNEIVLDSTDADEFANELKMKVYGHKLLWQMNIPFDHNRPWDFRGAYFFFQILQSNQRLCEKFVQMKEFQQFLANNKVDYSIVDHFIQECLTVAASLLNATVTIQFSNWPISDGYIDSQNVPSPPSAFPMTGTTFSPQEMHHFSIRLRNTIWHLIVWGARKIQARVVNKFYTSIGHLNLELRQVEAKHLFYAGRAEFLAEPIRPISNRIKHFGCASCKNPEEYSILRRRKETRGNYGQRFCTSKASNSLPNRLIDSNLTEDENRVQHRHCENYNIFSSSKEFIFDANLLARYKQVQMDFPEIDWLTLERRTFVLISFGSVAKVEFIPADLLRLFMRAFSRLSHLVIWQTNSLLKRTIVDRGVELPSNVRLLHWAPIKILLGHPNLRFAILHGGVNTINEALMFGKPILGLPLQGDQPSNLQRLADLGMADLLDIRAVWAGELESKIADFEKNYEKYARRAEKVSSIMNFYRNKLGGGHQYFWLQWATKKRHIIKEKGHRFFHFFYRSSIDHFALVELGSFACGLLVIIMIISK